MVIKILVAIMFFLSVSFGYFFGDSISFENQVKLLDTLRDSSAVIMAVLGIWLAVIFPEYLQNLVQGNLFAFSEKKLQRFRSVIYPFSLASFIVGLEIAIPFSAVIIKAVPGSLLHIEIFRKISFGLISAICFLQMFAILWMLLPVAIADRFALTGNNRRQLIDQLLPVTTHKE